MPNNTNTGSKKIYNSADLVDIAQKDYDAINEQDILNKYNQATAQQFVAQQDQNRIAENNFYNQMYNTQRTAMDTIRQANANAVSTGASRGVQAANELSALLGLQQESIASATEIANARRQTAQEETAAMLQNIVQASQDAAAQRQQALQSMIQAQSLRESELANASAAADRELTAVMEGGEAYNTYLDQNGKLGPDGEFAQGYTNESDRYIENQFDSKTIQVGVTWGAWDTAIKGNKRPAAELTEQYKQQLQETCVNVGIDEDTYQRWRSAQSDPSLPDTLQKWIDAKAGRYGHTMVSNSNYDVAVTESNSVFSEGKDALLAMNKYRKGGPGYSDTANTTIALTKSTQSILQKTLKEIKIGTTKHFTINNTDISDEDRTALTQYVAGKTKSEVIAEFNKILKDLGVDDASNRGSLASQIYNNYLKNDK